MKRFGIALIWFFVLWIGGLFVIGGVAGMYASAGSLSITEVQRRASEAGERAGQRYGALIFLSSLIVTAAGAFTGVLPGTAKKQPKPETVTAPTPPVRATEGAVPIVASDRPHQRP